MYSLLTVGKYTSLRVHLSMRNLEVTLRKALGEMTEDGLYPILREGLTARLRLYVMIRTLVAWLKVEDETYFSRNGRWHTSLNFRRLTTGQRKFIVYFEAPDTDTDPRAGHNCIYFR